MFDTKTNHVALYQWLVLVAIATMGSLALGQMKKGEPVRDVGVSLGKKPSGSIAQLPSQSDIVGMGRPNSTPQAAGFTVRSIASVPVERELVWARAVDAPSPFVSNGKSLTLNPELTTKAIINWHVGLDANGKSVVSLIRIGLPGRNRVAARSISGGVGDKDVQILAAPARLPWYFEIAGMQARGTQVSGRCPRCEVHNCGCTKPPLSLVRLDALGRSAALIEPPFDDTSLPDQDRIRSVMVQGKGTVPWAVLANCETRSIAPSEGRRDYLVLFRQNKDRKILTVPFSITMIAEGAFDPARLGQFAGDK